VVARIVEKYKDWKEKRSILTRKRIFLLRTFLMLLYSIFLLL
jgi:hypothetical protein